MDQETTNRVDFEKLRKKRQRKQTVKRLIAFCVIVGAVLGVVVLNSVLIESGFTTQLSDFVGSFGGSGYPINVPGGVVRDVNAMGGNLAVLNDTNLFIYNSNGKTVTNLQGMSDNTVMVTAASRVLTYDVGSRRYRINSLSKTLIDREMEASILCADLNDRGDFALVTAPRQFVAQVTVYDKNGTFLFEWRSSESNVSHVALSAKGDRLLVGCLGAEGGVLQSGVLLFDMYASESTALLARLEFPGELLLDLGYLDSGEIAVLTDQQYRVYSPNGTSQGSYIIENGTISGMERHGKKTLLLTNQKEARTQEAVLLDGSCKVLARLESVSRIRDMALGERRVYLLTDNGVAIYDHDLAEKNHFVVRGIGHIQLAGSRLYYLTGEEIGLVTDN